MKSSDGAGFAGLPLGLPAAAHAVVRPRAHWLAEAPTSRADGADAEPLWGPFALTVIGTLARRRVSVTWRDGQLFGSPALVAAVHATVARAENVEWNGEAVHASSSSIRGAIVAVIRSLDHVDCADLSIDRATAQPNHANSEPEAQLLELALAQSEYDSAIADNARAANERRDEPVARGAIRVLRGRLNRANTIIASGLR